MPVSHACYALVAGLCHWCVQREHDPALGEFIVANSREGAEPERRQSHRSGKPRIDVRDIRRPVPGHG